MSTNVTDKKQNFFKPIITEKDRNEVISSLITSQSLLQLKADGKKTMGPQDLTILKASGKFEDGIIGFFVTGPPLSPTEVTIAFDLSKAMFFCTGSLTEVYEGKYVIKFKKIYELQRRDAYRVTIPQAAITAKFVLTQVNDKTVSKEYRIFDLSAGGLGLAATDESAGWVPRDAEVIGIVKIGSHTNVDVSAKVKYQRKVTSEKLPYVHVGCEFTNMTVALSQKIAFLVNDCHRISFSRL